MMIETALQLENNQTNYQPGDAIRGRVGWKMEKVKAVEVSLLYFTTGRGTEDVTVADSKKWETTESAGMREFEFRAPSEPWNFDGKLVSLAWAIEVVVRPEMATHRINLVIAPGAVTRKLYSIPFRKEDIPKKAWMKIGS